MISNNFTVFLYRDWDKYFVYYEVEPRRESWIKDFGLTPVDALFEYMKCVYKDDTKRIKSIDITLGHREKVDITEWVDIWIDLANFDMRCDRTP
jgi:hypothetical protein